MPEHAKYGVNESRKLFCKKHQEFYSSDEVCWLCPAEQLSALESYEQELRRLSDFIDAKYPIGEKAA